MKKACRITKRATFKEKHHATFTQNFKKMQNATKNNVRKKSNRLRLRS